MAKRQKSHVKPTDLRGILQYIPKFRDRIFVISIDGAIVSDENFANLLLDFAVLRSLNIRVALVHGCLLYTSPSPRDAHESRMPSSA